MQEGHTGGVGQSPDEQHEPNDADRLNELADLASSRTSDALKRTMAIAMEELGMDVAFVSKFTEARMLFHALEGDAESFGWQEGGGVPLEGTFCKRVIDGRLPNVVPDAKKDERVNGLEVTQDADIGSYVGLPLRFSPTAAPTARCAALATPQNRGSGSATPGSWPFWPAWWPSNSNAKRSKLRSGVWR